MHQAQAERLADIFVLNTEAVQSRSLAAPPGVRSPARDTYGHSGPQNFRLELVSYHGQPRSLACAAKSFPVLNEISSREKPRKPESSLPSNDYCTQMISGCTCPYAALRHLALHLRSRKENQLKQKKKAEEAKERAARRAYVVFQHSIGRLNEHPETQAANSFIHVPAA